MVFIAYLVLAFTTIQFLVALVNLLIETNLPEAEFGSDDRVSVLIPALTDRTGLNALLDDLTNQDYRNIEILVFNNHPEERTSEIVTEVTHNNKKVKLINPCGFPRGWQKRNFACHSLSGFAKGRYFLFIDPGVKIGYDTISRAVSYSKKYNLDLVSVLPEQIMITFGEKIIVPDINYMILSLFPLVFIRKLRLPAMAAASGHLMMFTAKKYNWVKPHEKLKNSKVEEILIPRMFKKFGIHTACLLGDDSITMRTFNGYREAFHGFSEKVMPFFGNSFFLAYLFWSITTLGFIPVLIKLPLFLFVIYLILYFSARVFTSIAGRQNVKENLLYLLPQQFTLFLSVSKEFIDMVYSKLEWKKIKKPSAGKRKK